MSEETIERGFVTLGGRQAHYRRSGTGPPAVLLHACPGSSAAMTHLVAELAPRFTVLAIDLPGHGLSDPLDDTPPSIESYGAHIEGVVGALGVTRCVLYGIQAGASVGAELLRRRPELVAGAVLEGLPLFTEAERDEYLREYLPDFEPSMDGSHLLALWSFRRDELCYFPWYRRDHTTWLDPDLSGPEVTSEMQAVVRDHLRAGPAYRQGYEAYFRHDALGVLEAVEAPAVVVYPRGTDARRPASAHVSVLAPGDGGSAFRTSATPEEIAGLLGPFAPEHDPLPSVPDVPLPGRISKTFATTEFGQLLVRRMVDAPGVPLVLLHESPGSAATLEPLLRAMAADRPVYAIDTLGNGDSDAPDLERHPSFRDAAIEDYGPVVAAALRALGLEQVDLYGVHTGALIAIETALCEPGAIRSLALEGIPMFPADLNEDIRANFFVDLEPRWDGSHLVAAWTTARDTGVWFPWYRRRPDAAERFRRSGEVTVAKAHGHVVQLLTSGPTYSLSYRAAFGYDARERLPGLAARTLVGATATDPLHAFIAEAGQRARAPVVTTLPGDVGEKASVLRSFLAGEGDASAV